MYLRNRLGNFGLFGAASALILSIGISLASEGEKAAPILNDPSLIHIRHNLLIPFIGGSVVISESSKEVRLEDQSRKKALIFDELKVQKNKLGQTVYFVQISEADYLQMLRDESVQQLSLPTLLKIFTTWELTHDFPEQHRGTSIIRSNV